MDYINNNDTHIMRMVGTTDDDSLIPTIDSNCSEFINLSPIIVDCLSPKELRQQTDCSKSIYVIMEWNDNGCNQLDDSKKFTECLNSNICDDFSADYLQISRRQCCTDPDQDEIDESSDPSSMYSYNKRAYLERVKTVAVKSTSSNLSHVILRKCDKNQTNFHIPKTTKRPITPTPHSPSFYNAAPRIVTVSVPLRDTLGESTEIRSSKKFRGNVSDDDGNPCSERGSSGVAFVDNYHYYPTAYGERLQTQIAMKSNDDSTDAPAQMQLRSSRVPQMGYSADDQIVSRASCLSQYSESETLYRQIECYSQHTRFDTMASNDRSQLSNIQDSHHQAYTGNSNLVLDGHSMSNNYDHNHGDFSRRSLAVRESLALAERNKDKLFINQCEMRDDNVDFLSSPSFDNERASTQSSHERSSPALQTESARRTSVVSPYPPRSFINNSVGKYKANGQGLYDDDNNAKAGSGSQDKSHSKRDNFPRRTENADSDLNSTPPAIFFQSYEGRGVQEKNNCNGGKTDKLRSPMTIRQSPADFHQSPVKLRQSPVNAHLPIVTQHYPVAVLPSLMEYPQTIDALGQRHSKDDGGRDIALRAPCSCKKSRCLKLYCDCFRTRNFCDGCYCYNCANVENNESERHSSMNEIARRNPAAFAPRVKATPEEKAQKNLPGCSCRKSNCLKKYCECFNSGIKCSDRCRCAECQNSESTAVSTGLGSLVDEALALARQKLGVAQTSALLTSIIMSAANLTMPVFGIASTVKGDSAEEIPLDVSPTIKEV